MFSGSLSFKIVVQIPSSRRTSSSKWTVDIGLLLLPLLLLLGEAGVLTHRGGNGFPKHAGKFDLRFNVVRIL